MRCLVTNDRWHVLMVVITDPFARDVLLTTSHRRGRLARLLLTDTDWELMRTCPCPLWFVRSAELPQRPSALVAVDPFHAHDKPARLDDRRQHWRTGFNTAERVIDRVAAMYLSSSLQDSKSPAGVRLPGLP